MPKIIKTKKITIDKKEAMKNFFDTYSNDIAGELWQMNHSERVEYLTADIFIGCASAATGIPEEDFVQYAYEYFETYKDI
ncbi:hypothetical protein [Neisseria sp. Ec49-e6-T10]|uniref:hypothetical protein n=1 Tax=Neisseria sp. Ec49-e6-T10 TaxID=3140744 RepID=UPI003EB96F7D